MFSVPELCVREKMDRDSSEDSINDAMEVTAQALRARTLWTGDCGVWGAVWRLSK